MASLAEIIAAKKALNAGTAPAPQPVLVQSPISAEAMQELANATSGQAIPVSTVQPLPQVIEQSLDDMLDQPIGLLDKTILADAEICTADIVPRIRQLASLSDIQTEVEMKLLKNALMANPQAVALMLPEDIGLLVVGLRRITKEAIIAEATKKSSKKAPAVKGLDISKMTAKDFAEVEDF